MLSGPIYSSNIHDKKFISRLIQLLSQFENEKEEEEEEKEQSPTRRNNNFNPIDNFETFTRIQGTLQVLIF